MEKIFSYHEIELQKEKIPRNCTMIRILKRFCYFHQIQMNLNSSYIKISGFILLWLIYAGASVAQLTNRKAESKISPSLSAQLKFPVPSGKKQFTLFSNNLDSLKNLLKKNNTIRIVSVYEPTGTIVIESTWKDAEQLLQNNNVLFIDTRKKAKEELLFGFVDYAMNKISAIQHYFPNQNGNNISVSVKEQLFDTTDIDLKNRILSSNYASSTFSSHASIMATMIAGGGNVWYKTKGAAWKSKISSATFDNLLPEPNSYYQLPLFVQNHSYGTIVENYYGAEAAAYDASVINNTSLQHVFSAGNSGSSTSTTGIYTGIAGYANLTGNFKQAKNIITVGHVDSFGIVLTPSSKGPAFDGRVKPELVAFGEDGSSGATALVSGVATVLHQTYKDINGSYAPASLIKAILLNSADDVETAGIDFKSGYGSLNAYKAVKTILAGRYLQGSVTDQTQQTFSVNLPNGIKQLKLTLVWTDPAATPNTNKALVNDLDLEVKHLSTNTTWLPWVLNPAASISSLQQLPVRTRDSLNVVEQVSVDNPPAGNYEITVKGFSIPSGVQNFSIAYQLDSSDTFTWLFPTAADHLDPAQTNVIRFESGFTSSNGVLELSTDNGNNWQTVSNNADLTKGYFKFTAPGIYSKALLRMTVSNQTFVTDTFTISNRIIPAVGFNCTDSFLLVWPKVKEATAYQIYQLGNQYMELLKTTVDTFVVFNKQSTTSNYFSITPLINQAKAVNTYTFNYATQGTDCYVKSLLADLDFSNQGVLKLALGTTYNIKTISFEKFAAGGFVSLDKQNPNSGTAYQSLDKTICEGSNIYRAAIELLNGQIIYSNEAIIYYTGAAEAVLYPNPVQRNGILTVLPNPNSQLILELIDNYGRVVMQKNIVDYPQQVSIHQLSKGIYYYRLLKGNKKVQSGKLIVN